jgi:hypothetical protein
MNKCPVFSIITVTFNAGKVLGHTVLSSINPDSALEKRSYICF